MKSLRNIDTEFISGVIAFLRMEVPLYKYVLDILILDEDKINLPYSPTQYNHTLTITEEDLQNSEAFIAFPKKEGKLSSPTEALLVLRNTTIKPGVMAHECLHIMNNIFYSINHEPELIQDETSAYLLGFLVDEITEIHSKYINKV